MRPPTFGSPLLWTAGRRKAAGIVVAAAMFTACASTTKEANVTTTVQPEHQAAAEDLATHGSCSSVVASLGDLAAVPDDLNAAQLSTRMGELSSRLGIAAAHVSPQAAVDAETFAALLWQLAGAFERLATARTGAAARTAERIDEVVAATPLFLRAFADPRILASVMPAVTAACRIPQRSATPAAFVYFGDAVAAFVQTDVGQRPAFHVLADLASTMAAAEERLTAGPTSGMDSAYDACARDLTAIASGDNTGCDALLEACGTGEMLACNDLYWISALGSRYESVAATCGARIRFGDPGYGGFCDEIEP